MSSSLVLLVVLCVLVLSPCVSGSASYTLYSDNNCNTQQTSASGIGTASGVTSGITGVFTQCFSISSAGNIVSGIITSTNGGTNITTSSSFLTYNAASCPSSSFPSQSFPFLSGSSGSGSACVANSIFGGSGSAKYSISGAAHVTVLSIPIVILLLAALLIVLM